MASRFDIAEQHALDVHRCYDCGRYWALETYAQNPGVCPACASARIEAAHAGRVKAERVANSLRGAVTRAKKAKARHAR